MTRARCISFVLVTLVATLSLGSVALAQDTTNPPATTAVPTTAPPTTSAPATTSAPTTTQASSTSPNDSDNWLLILIGIVVVLGIVVMFVGRSRAQKASAKWRQQTTALLDE